MKMTLVEMVQNILSAMDSDQVNSIFDTEESQQVMMVLKETYDELFGDTFLPQTEMMLRIDGISNVNAPNYLKSMPDTHSYSWIRYWDHTVNNYREVQYLPSDEFMQMVLDRPFFGDNIFITTDPIAGITYPIYNNKFPTYYTIFGNDYLAFDSWNSAYETTMHQSNTMSFGSRRTQWQYADNFIPQLPDNLFPLFLAEAKATCFVNFKQISSSKEEQRARRQRVKMMAHKYKSRVQQKDSYYSGYDFSRYSRRDFHRR